MKTTASTAAIDTLHLTMRDIRNFIIGLRPELLGGTTLLVDVAAPGTRSRQDWLGHPAPDRVEDHVLMGQRL